MSLLPPDDDLDLIHTRRYETRVYQLSDEELLVRGAISDTKPPGLYVVEDPESLEIHQMQLELRVRLPMLEITSARVLFETHPQANCPLIANDYEKLVGLSIARGFTREIRDLFGGPKGCTHVNALMQAMAPAVVQSTWSVSVRKGRLRGESGQVISPEERRRRLKGNLNTCHLWAEDGAHVAALDRGERPGFPPLPVRERLRALGRDESDWD
ncbi:MAG TPA: DUF2889 domain-containing protein [Deltaproteobacteria bacterium]|nr:DUF2889 domain-containing protein [Deltaproteobacteria bacterium]